MELRNPGAYRATGAFQAVLIIFAVLGVATFGAGLLLDPRRAWASFVLNHFYFLSLALGGLFFAAIQWVTGAMWSAPIRRLSESFTAYLPIALVGFVILYFGIHHLYDWSHAEHVKGDLVLEGKSGYLSPGFFMARNLVALALWIFFAWRLVGNSLAQDASGDPVFTARNRALAPVFLIVFAITYTMASFDLLMSLDAHWFSTLFGVYCFAGLFYSVLAATCLMALYLRRKGPLEGLVNENHLHDLGKFMFAFTVFYAYIGFSQFLLIWYANLPEETMYFLHRLHGGWWYVSLFLIVGKFLVPFFLLLPRDAKRDPRVLGAVGVFMLVAHWIDLLWLVQPEFFEKGPRVGWVELGVTVGFIGLFGLAVTRFFARNTVVAIGDPRLAEAVLHHHQ
ncbi:MAG: molybdopterin oxidoreductase [Oligoflexia bacterium]|nr:molybdopterin oxidoreductase [Oligoflexia bacterium]